MTAGGEVKKKHRKMKQMQGLLLLSRLDHHKTKPIRMKKVLAVLQPQLLQLAYSAPEDQEMMQILGRIDLREAKLEQVPDGFVIHEGGDDRHAKKFKLQDKDKATTDAWFYGVYAAITEFSRPTIDASEDVSRKFAVVMTSCIRDEASEELEFELSCQLVLPLRSLDKPSIKWKIWKSTAQLQSFDDELRVSYGAIMKKVIFPRERKRDSLFGGLRRKSMQDLKEQQLAVYVEKLFEIPELSSDPNLVDKVKSFLGFDSFFEITGAKDAESDNQSDTDKQPTSQPKSSQFDPHITFSENVTNFEYREPSGRDSFQSYESRQSSSELPPLPRTLSRRYTTGSLFEDDDDEAVEVIPETDPKAARKLHKNIIQTVRDIVSQDEERVQEFQDQTKDFGRGKITATEYCAFLLGAVGAHECLQLVPQMAKLLPDEEKREALMAARAAIWRRTHRRNRRRSKQFSESIVFEKHKTDQIQTNGHSKLRPKSDTITGFSSMESQEPFNNPLSRNSMIETRHEVIELPIRTTASEHTSESTQLPFRSSMIETRSASIERSGRGRMSEGNLTSFQMKPTLLDPRRKLENRASFSMRRDSIQPEPVQEETPVSFDSDNNDDSDEDDWKRSLDRKASLNRNAMSKQPRRQSSFVENQYEVDENDGHPVHHRLQRRSSSVNVAEEAKAPVEEENPVLARLKKQGAINFMIH